MKGQCLPGSLFLDIHSGETVPSLALKLNSPSADNCSLHRLLSRTHLARPLLRTTPTTSPGTVRRKYSFFFFFYATTENDWIMKVYFLLMSSERMSDIRMKRRPVFLRSCRGEREGEIRSVQDSWDVKCKRQNITITSSLSNWSVSGDNHPEDIVPSFSPPPPDVGSHRFFPTSF